MPSEMTDTIILHPNDDGTYHWMCPNCKREDLGLSTETDLTAYCPNVTCPNCGFQFGVDKRYLNGVSASYICGECLLMQRFNGTCGNCGANALRRASIPVPLAMPNTDKELTVEEIAEIEARWISGASSEEDDDVNIGALIATVNQLRREGAVLREDLKYRCESLEELRGHRDRWLTMLNPPAFDTSVDDAIHILQSQLEQLRAENAQLRNALLPFALLDIRHLQERSDNEPIWAINKTQITNGHIRSAQKLIQQAVDSEKLT